MKLVLIGFAGVAGVLCRYGSNLALAGAVPYPWVTFGVNLLGSFGIGLAAGAAERQLLNPDLAVALTVGFLGGFTTFSAFSLETLTLFSRRETAQAIAYLLLSPLMGVAAALAGRALTSA